MSKKIITAGFVVGAVNLVVGMLLSAIYNFLTPSVTGEYININLFRPWSDPLMSLFFFYPFILGMALSWVWDKTKKLFVGKNIFEDAYKFGLAYWLVAGLPGMFVTYSSFQVSLPMVLTWSLTGLIEAVVAGFILAKLNK